MAEPFVTLDDIVAARVTIAPHIQRTALILSDSLSEITGHPVYLKHEHRQTTGAFKLRGATNAVARLSQEQRQHGVIAASTGNHGRALSYAAAKQGILAIICMSSLVPQNKVDEISKLGADVRIVGRSQDDAQAEVEWLVATQGLTMIPPFDHPDVIAGQGTLGLEIVEDLADVETVLVPLSGGGLIAGIATAVKALKPSAKIIGISMDRGAAMHASLAAGEPVLAEEHASLADSLGGGIGLDNRLTFAIVQALVDEVVLLTEDEIAAGIIHAYRQEREVIEGAAAVGIAALLCGKIRPTGPTAIVLSGRNIAMDQHCRLVDRAVFPELGS